MDIIFTHIELPNFSPKYDKNKKYGYTNVKYKMNLKSLLNKSSKNFCMYCYVRVFIEGKYFGHLEHSIEKANSKFLVECVPNIGWACPSCNDIFKRTNEKERYMTHSDIRIFEKNLKCNFNECKKECRKYQNLKKKYISNPNAHIILQPNGVKGFDTGLDLRVQYNIISAQFEPSEYQGEYSESEKQFIRDHINRFHLNDVKYQTNALKNFFEDVIEKQGRTLKTEENNLIVCIFKERLKNLSQDDILNVCKKLYTYYTIKFREE